MARTSSALPLSLTISLTLVVSILSACATSVGPQAPATSVAGGGEQTQAGQDIKVAQAPPPGIGGTGKQPGIGGTGQVAGAPGIGGTGIIGTVTGFGSILVNGYRVIYSPDQPVQFKDRTLRPDVLRVGQVVEVEADGRAAQLRARRISVRHEVAGPIQRIDRNRGTVTVLGQRVQVPPGVIFSSQGDRPLSIGGLSAGDHIDVSGLRRADGVIAASRVTKRGPNAPAVLRGRVTSSDPQGFSVNGIRVDAPLASRPASLASGRQVHVIGPALRGRLRAHRINVDSIRPFDGKVKRLSVEGYVTRAVSGGVAVGGVPISGLPSSARIRAGDRVILDGPVGPQGFKPTKVRAPQFDPKSLQGPRSAPGPVNPSPPRRESEPQRDAYPPVYRRPAPRPPVYRPPARRGR